MGRIVGPCSRPRAEATCPVCFSLPEAGEEVRLQHCGHLRHLFLDNNLHLKVRCSAHIMSHLLSKIAQSAFAAFQLFPEVVPAIKFSEEAQVTYT